MTPADLRMIGIEWIASIHCRHTAAFTCTAAVQRQTVHYSKLHVNRAAI